MSVRLVVHLLHPASLARPDDFPAGRPPARMLLVSGLRDGLAAHIRQGEPAFYLRGFHRLLVLAYASSPPCRARSQDARRRYRRDLAIGEIWITRPGALA